MVATFRGLRQMTELLGTLVHELVHLLNRRAIGPALPSWLDEGLADDLGASRIDPDGRLWPGTWSRTLDAHENEIRISGGEAALRDLADVFGPDGSAPGRLDLGAMLALEWEEFVAEQGAELHYAAAAAFIRMLLAAPAKSTVFAAGSPGSPRAARRPPRSFAGRSTGPGKSSSMTSRSGRVASSPACRLCGRAGGRVSTPLPFAANAAVAMGDNFRQSPVAEDVA